VVGIRRVKMCHLACKDAGNVSFRGTRNLVVGRGTAGKRDSSPAGSE
jgi:hypothetical protein